MKIKYDTTSPSCLVWLTGRRAGMPAGSMTKKGYWQMQLDGKNVRVHRIIWELLNGPVPEGKVIDRINQNRSDNRIENLRLASISDNNCNAHRKEREYPRGVYFTGDCWRGEFWKDGKRYMKKHSSYEYICEWVQQERSRVHGEFQPEHV